MHSLFGKRGALLIGLLTLALTAAVPGTASAVPEAGAKPNGFRLFARSLGALTINRVYCGLATTGEVCVDSTNSSTIGGGYWPKGTADQYVFNSGLQLAGVIGGTKPTNPWGGDTTGAFFFDPKGTTQHGQQVEPIYNASNPDDVAIWPEAALVPQGDAVENLYNPLLRGRVSASQGDVWWLSWEGNPTQNAGRSHPLGVLVETRGLGWNFPAGNEDIVYFVYTFYNVTSLDPAAYASIRPGLRETIIARAQQFHELNNAAFGVTLPTEGYTIENLFAAFGADMDVADAGDNYSSVVLPFALGHTYGSEFIQPAGWSFDPGIFAPPFFPASGFVGVKYLQSPTGAGEIQLFSNTINGGAFGDAANTKQLYRYLSGTLSEAQGDAACSYDPVTDRICYVNNGGPADMRFFQSSTPLTLAPGEFGSIVVAYIFAAPYKPASYVPGTEVRPGDPRLMSSVSALTTTGANMIDTLAGLISYEDANDNGIAEQNEFTVATGSLLGKSLVAQAVFDNQFLLPFAPEAPEFYLVPGDNKVTVLWRPSLSESTGDPFFQIASSATITPEGGGDPVPNPLYDPNYREFDVEGYRIYRGRVDSPDALTLLAQFDYTGTAIFDFQGQVNPTVGCAPELGLFDDCAADYLPEEFAPGVARTVATEIPLVGEIVQLTVPGSRALLGTGVIDTVVASIDSVTNPASPDTTFTTVFVSNASIVLQSDTALTGNAAGYPLLRDTGVPFVYVDETARNNFRYFYAVTAFDVNSFQSGPSSLESPRIAKAVTPTATASNFASGGEVVSSELLGRGQVLSTGGPLPSLDATNGTFSGPFPPADAWEIGLGAFVSEVLSQPGSLAATLDSIQLGDPYSSVAHKYWYTTRAGSSESVISVSVLQTQEIGVRTGTTQFRAVPVDDELAGRFGGGSEFLLPGQVSMSLGGTDYWGLYGRGCTNGRAGFGSARECAYNGSRWFDGPSPTTNEMVADPIRCNSATFSGDPMDCYNNAGGLTGVTTIFNAQCYQAAGTLGTCAPLAGVLAGARRAADFNVYWGTGGKVDSVVDVTHNVLVPGPDEGFDTHVGGTWGILNHAATLGGDDPDLQEDYLTMMDMACVEPFKTIGPGSYDCPETTVDGFTLSSTAVPGPVMFFSGMNWPSVGSATRVPATDAGFVMYIAGDMFTFELAGGAVPAAGTVWSLRQYAGAILNGKGDAGDYGPYEYSHPEEILQLTAVGAELRANYTVSNVTSLPTLADLDRVHTVPDPYYVTSEFEQTTDNKVIRFVNLPSAATIRIYSSSGVLVDVIEHNSPTSEGAATWNVRNRNNQVVASGVYFYHIEAGDARRVGRFTVVNFAQ